MGLMDELRKIKKPESDEPTKLTDQLSKIKQETPSHEEALARVLARQQQVNPPPSKIPKTTHQCVYCGQIFSMDMIEEHVANCSQNPEKEEEKKEKKEKTQCEHCGKMFTYINKHKCKNVDQVKLPLNGEKVNELIKALQEKVDEELEEKVDEDIQKELAKELAKEFEEKVDEDVQKKFDTFTNEILVKELEEESYKAYRKEHNIKSNTFILLVDCIETLSNRSVKGAVSLAEVLQPIIEEIKKKYNVPHWNAFDYGKGGPLLNTELERRLTKTPEVTNGLTILASSTSPEYIATQDVLVRYALQIIKAVR